MKKAVIVSVSVVAALCALVAIVLGIELVAFLKKTPVITPRERVSVSVGKTLGINELAVIERATQAYVRPTAENIFNKVTVSEDGQSVHFGGTAGDYEVIVEARGANSELRSEIVLVRVC